MRVAVLTDIHGNIHALEAVLEHLGAQNIDQVVVAGDTVNVCPDSRVCWERVKRLGCPILRGNHERYLYDYGTPRADPAWSEERFKPLLLARAQFTSGDLAGMRALPMTYKLPGLLITHALPRNDYGSLRATTTTDELRAALGDVEENYIVRGHNHQGFEHHWDDKHLYSLNALGLPLDGNRDAPYGILEQTGSDWILHRQRVPYNVEAALARFDQDYLAAAGPAALLLKEELRTAELRIIPFLNAYLARVDSGEMTLEHAVAQYLNTL